jgi:hypothetical protein
MYLFIFDLVNKMNRILLKIDTNLTIDILSFAVIFSLTSIYLLVSKTHTLAAMSTKVRPCSRQSGLTIVRSSLKSTVKTET